MIKTVPFKNDVKHDLKSGGFDSNRIVKRFSSVIKSDMSIDDKTELLYEILLQEQAHFKK